MELLFGTTNPGKLRELRRLVAGLPIRVLSPDELGRPLPEVEEDGATFEENAAKKAVEWARFAGLHAVADDSGLCVDALAGAPGVRSARWSEEALPGSLPRDERDEANNDLLLSRLADVPEERRGAEYRAVLVLADPAGGVVAVVRGVCRGRIGRARRGDGGFGYDPLFLPEADPSRTMAELSPEAKDAISHRGAAFRLLLPYLGRLVRPSAP
jgi:XTP/dITP diphosphohydrolase